MSHTPLCECCEHMTDDDDTMLCVDCALSTNYGHGLSEYYTVTDEVWAASMLSPDGGMLCVGCLEARLHRRLVPGDFPDFFINIIALHHGSERLVSRMTTR